jgi:hypothetical protein
MRAAAPCAAAALRPPAAPPAGAAAAFAPRRRRRGRARSAAAPPPFRPAALHRHVAGWLDKPDAPPPRTPADAPQTPPQAPPPPPASSLSQPHPLRALRRLLRPLLPRPPLVEYTLGAAGVDAAEARRA